MADFDKYLDAIGMKTVGEKELLIINPNFDTI